MSHVSRYLDPALVEHLNHMRLSAASVVQGATAGLHRSAAKGASLEFRQHRFYVPGDEPRRLDWRILARTDRPYVKEYDEETNLRCLLLLDRSGSMGYGHELGPKFDYAARLAAALAYLMLQQAENVGIALSAQKLDPWIAPHAGPSHLARLLDALEQTAPAGPSQLAAALHDVAERLDRRALVIVLSDFFLPIDLIRSGLAHLRHGRHEVIAIQVVDRDEEAFPFHNFARFRGLEGEPSQVIEPAFARRAYLDAFRRHRHDLQETCRSLRIHFQPLVTDKPILDALRLLLCS